jgi:hypothetical protein
MLKWKSPMESSLKTISGTQLSTGKTPEKSGGEQVVAETFHAKAPRRKVFGQGNLVLSRFAFASWREKFRAVQPR